MALLRLGVAVGLRIMRRRAAAQRAHRMKRLLSLWPAPMRPARRRPTCACESISMSSPPAWTESPRYNRLCCLSRQAGAQCFRNASSGCATAIHSVNKCLNMTSVPGRPGAILAVVMTSGPVNGVLELHLRWRVSGSIRVERSGSLLDTLIPFMSQRRYHQGRSSSVVPT